MFNVGQLVWVWIKGEEPTTGLVVEVLEGAFYNVLAEEQICKLSDDRIWKNKEDCVEPVPFFLLPRRIYPGLIVNQMIPVQHMSLPTGLIFYLDKRGSKEEK
jgi:hypothetical protein